MGRKICGFALRIAAILHVVKMSEIDDDSNNNDINSNSFNSVSDNSAIISATTMTIALEIVALLVQHAIAAYNLIGVDQKLQDAKELFNWIVEQNHHTFTQAEITYALRNRKLGRKERLIPALKVLFDRNILQAKTDSSTRKPTTYFLVNPKLVHK